MDRRNERNIQEDRILDNMFLTFLRDKLEFQESAEEITSIKDSVRALMMNVMEEVKQINERFEMAHLIQFGDMADGTKVLKPDEFKFMVVLKELSEPDVIKMERACENWSAYRHVRITDKGTGELWSDFCQDGKMKSTTPILNVFGSSTILGHHQTKSLREVFSENVESAVRGLSDRGQHMIQSEHGTLSIDTDRTSSACTPQKLSMNWHSPHETLRISVILQPAIEIREFGDLLNEIDAYSHDINKAIQETGHVHLIPSGHEPECKESACFYVSCAEAEKRLVSELGTQHKQCIKLLKGLFNTEKNKAETFLLKILNPYYILASLMFDRKAETEKNAILDRVLNVVIIEHAINCPNTTQLVGCIQSVLHNMENVLSVSSIPALTYFKEKKLNSIYFKSHNIFSEEEVRFSTQGFQAAGATLSRVQAKVSKLADETLGRNSLRPNMLIFASLMILGCPVFTILRMTIDSHHIFQSDEVFGRYFLVSELSIRCVRLFIVWKVCRKYLLEFNGIVFFRFLFFICFSCGGILELEFIYPLDDILRLLDIMFGSQGVTSQAFQTLPFSLHTIAMSWLVSLHTVVGFIVYKHYGKYTNILLLSFIYRVAIGFCFHALTNHRYDVSENVHHYYDYYD